MRAVTRDGLVCRLTEFERVVEIGVGHRPVVARELAARGIDVTATDIHDRQPPDGVRFVRDDVTDPTLSVYTEADALYALNLPPELHGAVSRLADQIGCAFLFTTLGGDPPTVPVSRETVPGETIFVYDSQRA
ncbi:UPF0146 family protein [Halobacteriaceae archaeon SHR40]|uniref:UPF0146 family protein n=1 Tax=Halovenus amylolytica TaxID=2500550 RepID=UPI000FE337A2